MDNLKSLDSSALDSFEGHVRGLSSEGLGVVEHPSGRVFFVRGTWPGDHGVFKPTRFEKRYGYAELVELSTPSPDRVTPACEHQGVKSGSCGGCPWMIGTYESQLKYKQHRVMHALERAKMLNEGVLRPIMDSSPLGYRNRAQFKTDGVRFGFVSDESHNIAEIKDCIVMTDSMRARLKAAKASMPRDDWKPSNGFQWCFVEVDDLMEESEAPWLNKRRPFIQGNSTQNLKMRTWLGNHLKGEDREAPVLELFCGSGNFTQVASSLGFTTIHAYEMSRDSIAELNEKNLPGVQAHVLDLGHTTAMRAVAREAAETKVLILDPPRTGLKGIDVLAKELKKLHRILYVSCDTATFVRDAAALVAQGFELTEVQPLDLFPQTSHVETLAEFTR